MDFIEKFNTCNACHLIAIFTTELLIGKSLGQTIPSFLLEMAKVLESIKNFIVSK